MIKQSSISYREDNPAAYDCFRHPHADGKYMISVFDQEKNGFPSVDDSRVNKDEDMKAFVYDMFTDVLNSHAESFAEETGMELDYYPKNHRFELTGLDVKYSFADQAEAEAHAEKVYRFDAECGEILADFKREFHQAYEPDLETHRHGRDGFYCIRGIKDPRAFEDYVWGGAGQNEAKHDAMRAVADRFHEQYPDYRMGVYFSPNSSVALIPMDWDGKHETLETATRPTKKYLESLTPEQTENLKQMLHDFDLAADDFIYAGASGIDRGAENDFAKAVENLNDIGDKIEM